MSDKVDVRDEHIGTPPPTQQPEQPPNPFQGVLDMLRGIPQLAEMRAVEQGPSFVDVLSSMFGNLPDSEELGNSVNNAEQRVIQIYPKPNDLTEEETQAKAALMDRLVAGDVTAIIEYRDLRRKELECTIYAEIYSYILQTEAPMSSIVQRMRDAVGAFTNPAIQPASTQQPPPIGIDKVD